MKQCALILLVLSLSSCAVVKDTIRKVQYPEPGDCIAYPQGSWHPERAQDDWFVKLTLRCSM